MSVGGNSTFSFASKWTVQSRWLCHFLIDFFASRYKQQILYGCQDPDCRTPTCLSYQRRVSEGSFRRYTELSARTLACYLASLDNAESGLCRNVPRLSSEFSSTETLQRAKKRPSHHDKQQSPAQREPETRDRITGRQHVTISPLSGEDAYPNIPSSIADSSSDPISLGVDNLEDKESAQLPASGTQKMKDPKSFTQNLFDTLSLRMVEWLPLRRPNPDTVGNATSMLKNGRGDPGKLEQPGLEDPEKVKAGFICKSPQARDRIRSMDSQPTSRLTLSQPAALELKVGQTVKRLSLDEMETWRQTPRTRKGDMSKNDRISSRKSSRNTPSANLSAIDGQPSPPAMKHRPRKTKRPEETPTSQFYQNGKEHGYRPRVGSTLSVNAPRYRGYFAEVKVEEQQLAGNSGLSTSEDLQRKPKSGGYKANRLPPIQSATHLTNEIINGLSQLLIENEDDDQNWKEELRQLNSKSNMEDVEWQYATSHQRLVFPFVAQSVFYGLACSGQLLRSFRKDSHAARTDWDDGNNLTLALDLPRLESMFRKLFELCPGDLILNSLWSALERLFIPPKELSITLRNYRRWSQLPTGTSPNTPQATAPPSSKVPLDESLTDGEAAYIATVTLFALISSLPKLDIRTWRGLVRMRAMGMILPDAEVQKLSQPSLALVIDATDSMEYDLALRLLSRLVRSLTARLTFHEISKATSKSVMESKKQRKPSVVDLILDSLREHYRSSTNISDPDNSHLEMESPVASAIIIEWLRTLFLKEWDGKSELARSSTAGGTVQILSLMYKDRKRLGLASEDFHTAFLSERLDPMEMPVEWLGRSTNNKTLHILSSSFLFPPSALVIYFRALNYAAMSKSYESAMTVTRHVTQTAFSSTIPVYDDVGLLARLRTSMSTYLVLVVRRDNVLTDTLNQLWRREKRELMRPLKVQMGMDEGEEGVDHGGVQQEFFRVLFGQALDPSYGMFTLDSRTHSTWFQPCALEPLYKYELLGLLMSLAIYNGLTLPVNFPIALYRKLLGLKVKHLDHIHDGWPDLAKGLEDMLSWDAGDVSDVFVRTYEFSFEAFGSVQTVDMERLDRDSIWPFSDRVPGRDRACSSISEYSNSRGDVSQHPVRRARISTSHQREDASAKGVRESFRTGILKGVEYNAPLLATLSQPPEEAKLVTNKNREKFVRDYIFWLTDKSIRPQYEAFARGFYTCLERLPLSIFTPEALKTVVEGIQTIDVDELERHARYEGGFSPTHPMIQDFWQVVKHYPSEKKARLLEFVTASDRVPVNGISSIMFVIQRNGVGDTVSSYLSLFYILS